MKYNIFGYDQRMLMQLDILRDIDFIDLALLEYIRDIQDNERFDGINPEGSTLRCVWLHHSKILEDLPALRLAKQTLCNRLCKLKKLGFLQSIQLCKDGISGSRTYYRTTGKYLDLLYLGADNERSNCPDNERSNCPDNERSNSYNNTLNNTSNIRFNNKLTSNDVSTQKSEISAIEKSSSFLKNKSNSVKDNSSSKKEVQSFVDLYNKTCTKLPKMRALTEKREKAIKNILKKYNLETIAEVFNKANKSQFLTGHNDRNWKADIDFILREDKFVNILEDRYNLYDMKKLNIFHETVEMQHQERYDPIEGEKRRKEMEASGKRVFF